ncbi:DUF3307 domain-containing protein [Lutibacter sp.]|uniref:DUF3307 domain-containing protein n=1 Tax=Lutibacter sp. TaxID=1925666 RepID=UPI0025BA95AF|nr:DUF3307 domain-containing protein [Lutibacter sp.]MCF6182471.1 DUF3307 domain-containing protein [Lutibacter sp.]
MLTLAIKFILAHLMGDFLFQPNKWVKHKKKRKYKSKYLYWHILIHTVLLLIALQFNFNYWKGIIIVIISHYITDLVKLYLNKKVDSRILFFADQILHFIVITGVIYYYYPFKIDLTSIYSIKSLLLITFILITTYVSSVIIKILISKWKINNDSTNQAGKYIGILERLFIFSFILMNYWEGIGFLLAAKSVFRFGDLSNAKDRNLTEYILIGTLLSFGMAIATAFGYNYLIELSNNF